MSKTIVLTGGGSAGHVTPNLALVPGLEENGYEAHYIGTANGIERTIVTSLPYHAISAGKLRRYFSLKNVSDIFRILRGYGQAKKILEHLKPALVFAKGGFVSVPVVYAAAKLGIPVVLHESDYTPGLANRLCTKKAGTICFSFDNDYARAAKGIYTGSPVRGELFLGDRARGLSALGFSGTRPVLLIMGGSLGAVAVNDAVRAALPSLPFDVIHICGKGNLDESLEGRDGYRQFEYVKEDLADFFATCDIALSRSGANSVFELLALGIPALLVPLPKTQSRGDQILNAQWCAKNGFAKVLPQEELTPERLVSELADLLSRRAEFTGRIRNSPAAEGARNVLDVILKSVN